MPSPTSGNHPADRPNALVCRASRPGTGTIVRNRTAVTNPRIVTLRLTPLAKIGSLRAALRPTTVSRAGATG